MGTKKKLTIFVFWFGSSDTAFVKAVAFSQVSICRLPIFQKWTYFHWRRTCCSKSKVIWRYNLLPGSQTILPLIFQPGKNINPNMTWHILYMYDKKVLLASCGWLVEPVYHRSGVLINKSANLPTWVLKLCVYHKLLATSNQHSIHEGMMSDVEKNSWSKKSSYLNFALVCRNAALFVPSHLKECAVKRELFAHNCWKFSKVGHSRGELIMKQLWF